VNRVGSPTKRYNLSVPRISAFVAISTEQQVESFRRVEARDFGHSPSAGTIGRVLLDELAQLGGHRFRPQQNARLTIDVRSRPNMRVVHHRYRRVRKE